MYLTRKYYFCEMENSVAIYRWALRGFYNVVLFILLRDLFHYNGTQVK